MPRTTRSDTVGLQGRVALLTAGRDKSYAVGLADALAQRRVPFDFICGDDMDDREFENSALVKILNLRGDQSEDAPFLRKAIRVLEYYRRLIVYAAQTSPALLHILWNNRFEVFDRTVLMLYYQLLGKRVVLTAHNVNSAMRDGTDTRLNRFSLKIQYQLSDHIFVHTSKMRDELTTDFAIPAGKISVIPFGINETMPNSDITSVMAKRMLGIAGSDRAILFFGNLAPYKGLEYLIRSFGLLCSERDDYRLILAGRPKGSASHWQSVRSEIVRQNLGRKVIEKVGYIPDDEVEIYFKAADILVLPYTHIYQSGVLCLGYSFGLPVVATNVGSLADEIIEGHTGFVCRARDSSDLARAIRKYFDSDVYRDLDRRRHGIQAYARERYSWSKVGEITEHVYRRLLVGSGRRRGG